MKSKEFIRMAEACRDSFVSGIKKALGIKKHYPSFDPKPRPGFDKEIMRQVAKDTAKVHPKTTTMGWRPENESSGEAMSSFIQMAEAMGGVRRSLDEAGTQAQKLIQAMTEYNSFVEEINRTCREQTNNWKKMHGLPMRRKTMQERKRKTK